MISMIYTATFLIIILFQGGSSTPVPQGELVYPQVAWYNSVTNLFTWPFSLPGIGCEAGSLLSSGGDGGQAILTCKCIASGSSMGAGGGCAAGAAIGAWVGGFGAVPGCAFGAALGGIGGTATQAVRCA